MRGEGEAYAYLGKWARAGQGIMGGSFKDLVLDYDFRRREEGSTNYTNYY
jgi:hypothetical protein